MYKLFCLLYILAFPGLSFSQAKRNVQESVYVLIDSDGNINSDVVSHLPEPLLAIAAYYSGLGGTNCTQDSAQVNWCDLTSELGLGNQGSEKHLALLEKWFPDDKAARQLVAQACYQRPSGASSFSEYEKLSLVQTGNMVTISYKLMIYSRGDVRYINAKDKIKITDDRLVVIKRSIWKNL